jgi:predicted RNA-binding protein with PUA-like domain
VNGTVNGNTPFWLAGRKDKRTMSKKIRFWLVKSEPAGFSFDDLLDSPGRTTLWDGVRNYEARNFMREMTTGDGVVFYHSSSRPPGAVGAAEIVREAYPDPSQFDPMSRYYDEASSQDEPRWLAVDIRAVEKFGRVVSLQEMKGEPALKDVNYS